MSLGWKNNKPNPITKEKLQPGLQDPSSITDVLLSKKLKHQHTLHSALEFKIASLQLMLAHTI